MMIKKIVLSLLIFLFSSIFFNILEAAGTLEEQREKALGVKHKDYDSTSTSRTKFIAEIEKGNLNKVKDFLKSNGNNLDFTVDGANPLTHAASINNLVIVEFFLNTTTINIDVTDELGNTALINASERGNIEIVDFLINKGADVNYQNDLGLTAVMKAAEKNNFFIAKLLLKNNADTTKSDYTGRTLREIVENNRDKKILKLLN
ncbi:MAG: hypothetical protein CFH26_00581 [Alphaproteobacteria bacterium MarineAlpha6_Bin4]|nr:MAG: hypothetical protein CFH27_00026 [Alphaproteobacteria bacterium MarineAlpha6_Bin5]PPR37712.1 MAG: hypothetical protein CFH26_00581 [Alphaproteobacteria bacterium MarineAlpha6_Bin4]